MHGRLFLMALSLIFLLGACATPGSHKDVKELLGSWAGAIVRGAAKDGEQTEPSTASDRTAKATSGRTPAVEPSGNDMDRQEQELKLSLSTLSGTDVQREINHLAITIGTDVLFDADSAALKEGTESAMDRMADVLKRYPDTRVRIDGHTDSTGSERHNLSLSDHRAEAVREALVRRGVEPRRIVAQGFGESRPVASNATETGRQLNRRVTILVMPFSSPQL